MKIFQFAAGLVRRAVYCAGSVAEKYTISHLDLIVSFFTAFICANIFAAASGDFTDLFYIRDLSIAVFSAVLVMSFAFIWCVVFILGTVKVINWCFLCSALILSLILAASLPGEIFFCLGLAFVLLFIIKYVTQYDRLGLAHADISHRSSLIAAAVMFLVFTVAVSYFTVVKYMTYSHSAFDFGIFCQMFEQMAKTGLPFTTIERSEYLSHFAVHFSPVYYLLLPGYMLFRSPVYLLVMQAAAVGASVFPLHGICRRLGMSGGVCAAFCAVGAFFPSMAAGCFYDFHENKFLSLFILCMIYFVLRENIPMTAVSALLILSVKEDAAIYVIAIALWMLLTKRKRLLAVIICGGAVLYFLFACKMVQLSGGDIMMSRLENYYAANDGGFIDVIKTCFTDIGFLIKEVFLGADTEKFSQVTYGGQKLEFVLWLAVPLLFMPFTSKHSTHLVLLIPMLVINLMPNWVYQYDINFQYTYGTAALMLASAALTLSEKSAGQRRNLALGALTLSLVLSASLTYPKASGYFVRYRAGKADFQATSEALKVIPRDASVTAYGFFVPHLAYIDDLHTCPDYYADYVQTDYVVLDSRYSGASEINKLLAVMDDDYELVIEKGYAAVYRRTSDG